MNPLLSLHQQARAETQFYDQIEIVSTFGSPQAEYAAIHKSCGMMDLPFRSVVELTGRDRHVFLNNLITQEVWSKSEKRGLTPGQTCYAFLLNLKGRVVLDLHVIELDDRTWLEVDTRLARMLAELLDKYVFSEQVRINLPEPGYHPIGLHGPGAQTILREEGVFETGRLIGREVVVWRNDPCGVPGYHILMRSEDAPMIWNHLQTRYSVEIEPGKRRLRPIGWAAFNTCRIEAGTPLFGIDFELAEPSVPGVREKPVSDDSTPKAQGVLPAETGLLDRAVSFTKGCYLGQEVVARMYARGQIARRLVGLKIENGMLPIAGEHVFDDQDNQIGAITSSTISPILSESAIALAILKKPHFETGRQVRVPAEGALRQARVVDLPFYSHSSPRSQS
jgi:aminomethyltransferase